MGRVILVPVEDTEEALQAVDWTLREVYRKGDVLHLLHVVFTRRPFGSGIFSGGADPTSPLSSGEHQETVETEHARHWMQSRFLPAAEEAQAACEVLILKAADPSFTGDVICAQAEELSAALLVVTASKPGGRGAAAFHDGSTVQHCLQNCGTTVLAWRPH